jgi:hypothetical protein
MFSFAGVAYGAVVNAHNSRSSDLVRSADSNARGTVQ